MIEALISGQAGRFVLFEKRQHVLYDLDSVDTSIHINAGEVRRVFGGSSDIQRLEVKDHSEARQMCELAWSKDRALRFTLLLLDLDEDQEANREYAECLEELLNSSEVAAFVESALLTSPIAVSVLSRVQEGLQGFPRVTSVFGSLAKLQPIIGRVVELLSDALNNPTEDFDRDQVRDAITESGAIGEIVHLIATGRPVDFLVMELIARLRSVEGARAVIESWTAQLRTKRGALPATGAEDDGEIDEDEETRGGLVGRRAYERVMRQQAAIIERLRLHDLDGARRFVLELINSQTVHSTPEQLGKSLSRLSHQAKEIGVAELQLEWAQLAVEYSPNDPLTFAHLADAYITTFQFAEAGRILDHLAQIGDTFTSQFGRARILRAKGLYEDARKAFLEAAAVHLNNENVTHALASAAECLGDMGDFAGALAEYEALTTTYPLDGALWSGRASVLMDLGRTTEAVQTFNVAEKHDAGYVAQAGRAAAHRYSGNFEAALKIYSSLIRSYPNNFALLGGRAEVYRDEGKYELALYDYQKAMEIAPFHPAPIFGVVKVLRDLRRYGEALETAEAGISRFPYHSPLVASKGSILMRQHRYREALSAYDAVSSNFPLDYRSEKNRADALRRLGLLPEALAAYDAVLSKHPFYRSAVVSRASLLIEMSRLTEAAEVLSSERPASRFDWAMELLRALLLEARGDSSAAEAVLANGSRRSPFERVRRNFKAALARHKLIRNEASRSRSVIEPAENEISNVIWLHALAASGRKSSASKTFQRILETTTEPKLINLSTEIASRYRLIERPAEKSREWIFMEERNALLLAAA